VSDDGNDTRFGELSVYRDNTLMAVLVVPDQKVDSYTLNAVGVVDLLDGEHGAVAPLHTEVGIDAGKGSDKPYLDLSIRTGDKGGERPCDKKQDLQ
jgi:hypothetical protein